jgi:glutathione-specific gamma-glutamylcyclotransferase
LIEHRLFDAILGFMSFAPVVEQESSDQSSISFSDEEYIWADWVFAYGSLIWNPEVDFESSHIGKVFGRHRNFCVRSTKYRGTPSAPGVVLGLDTGGSCIGVVYKLNQTSKTESIEKLYQREMPNRIYTPILVNVHLANNQKVRALTFAANRSHDAYLSMTEEQLLNCLKVCVGDRGANKDYALNTWRALKAHGVHDERLEKIATQLLRSNDVLQQS